MLDHTAREPAPPIARRAALRSHGALGAGLGRLCVPYEPFASRRQGAVAVGDQEVGGGHIGAPTPREPDPGSQLGDMVRAITECYPKEIVDYYSPAYSKQLLDQLDATEIGAA